jgi:hypothetical protein
MSNPAISVFISGIYEMVPEALLMIVPTPLLALFGFPCTNEVCIRVTEMLVCFFAFYNFLAACYEVTDFFRWMVYARSLVPPFFYSNKSS